MSTINREDALDAVYERIRQIGYENNPLVLSIRQVVRDLPPAQPEKQCESCRYRHIWMTQRMNGIDYFGHGGATG